MRKLESPSARTELAIGFKKDECIRYFKVDEDFDTVTQRIATGTGALHTFYQEGKRVSFSTDSVILEISEL